MDQIRRKSLQSRPLEDVSMSAIFIGIVGGLYLGCSLEFHSWNPKQWIKEMERREEGISSCYISNDQFLLINFNRFWFV